eukprot:14071220-Heterocapsa_arctica.AAC.1
MAAAAFKANSMLTEQLNRGGFAQNITKQVATVKVAGSGGMAAERDLLRGFIDMPGKVARTARYLGPWLHMRGSFCSERDKRIIAARIGLSLLGQYWWSKTQWKMKRLVFMGRVIGAIISGLEALLPTNCDYHIFDK